MNNCKYCNKPISKNKFCNRKHYGLFMRGKSLDRVSPSKKEYIEIRVNGEKVLLHRFMFERFVRPLKAGEIVHHIDENKRNNMPYNLEALSGQRAHLHAHNYHKNSKQVDTNDYNEIPF